MASRASASPPVTIRNHGGTTLGGFAGGAPFDPHFGAGQNCGGGVPPGGSRQYFFTFKPVAEGEVCSTSSSRTAAGPFAIGLRGTGVGPRLWVTPLELDFGTVPVGGTSPPQVVTVTNVGMATLSFTPSAPGVYEATSSSSTNAGGFVVGLRGNTPVP